MTSESTSIASLILSDRFLGAIFSTIFIIMVGYYLRRRKIVSDSAAKTLSTILLSAAIPALAFKAFMTNITQETYTTGISVLIFGFVAYILLIVLGEGMFSFLKGDKRTCMAVLLAFGSTTFFGIPIINGFFGNIGTIYANIFNIAYRVFLYSYALIRMSGLKFEKKNIRQICMNPIIIATFLGLILWLVQSFAPQMQVTSGDKVVSVAFYRIDQTLPWLYKGISYLADLSSPLAWLAIGMTLASVSLTDAAKEKLAWLYSVLKLLAVPAIFLVIMILIRPFAHLSYEAITAIVIMLATPPATVAVSFAIRYEREALLASNISLLATVLAVFAIIFWIFVTIALHAAAII